MMDEFKVEAPIKDHLRDPTLFVEKYIFLPPV
jgi:hypothetical protein